MCNVMPRKKSVDHPLWRIRESVPITQVELGRRLGVSGSTLQKVENGETPMNEELCRRAALYFGCQVVYDFDPETGDEFWTLDDHLPRPEGTWTSYTLEDFRAHQKSLSGIAPDNLSVSESGLAAAVQLLLRAAEKAGLLSSVECALEKKLVEVVKKFKLQPHVAGYLRDECDYPADLAEKASAKLTSSIILSGIEMEDALQRTRKPPSWEEADAPIADSPSEEQAM